MWNVTTRECVRYLQADKKGDEQRKSQAFEHLVAIMLRASDKLYISRPTRNVDVKETSEKYDFVVMYLLEKLSPWRALTAIEVKSAADMGKFAHLSDETGHLGHQCRQRVLNKIRDQSRAAQQLSTFDDESYAMASPKMPPPKQEMSAARFDELLAKCNFLSDHEANVARALYECREMRGPKQSGPIAAAFGVSVQSARKYLRDLKSKFRNALRTGDSSAEELFDALAPHHRVIYKAVPNPSSNQSTDYEEFNYPLAREEGRYWEES